MVSPAFRRPTDPPQDEAGEDEIPAELLESIPELGDSQHAPQGQQATRLPAGTPPPQQAAPVPRADPADLHAVLDQVRRQMEAAFAKELARVEDSFSWMVKDLENRLDATRRQLEAARVENARVKVDYDRKTEAIRELKRTLEGL